MPPLLNLFGPKKNPVSDSADLKRILALPKRPQVLPGTATAQALVEHETARFSRGPRTCRCQAIQKEFGVAKLKGCITQLNYAQAWALHEMTLCGGVVAQLATGSGKTLIDVIAPLAVQNCKIAVLLVPSTLVRQLELEYLLVAEHFRVPGIHTHLVKADDAFNYAKAGEPTLYVLPYSQFQRHKATTYLETYKPDLIICDEAQNLSSRLSTRGSRFLRFFSGSGGKVRLCAWSGTLTDDELADYDHFAGLALGMGSPLPLDGDAMGEWNDAITPEDWPAPEGALVALKNDPGEHIQDAFHRRLVETLGIVFTVGSSIDTPLEIKERTAPALPDTPLADPRAPNGTWPGVKNCLSTLRATWRRPDGEELVDALSVSRCARELACGLFLRWRFENGETESLIKEWLAARKEWRCELREKMARREPHLDSPLLCALAAMRYWGGGAGIVDYDDEGKVILAGNPGSAPELPVWKSSTWMRWAAIKNFVHPVTESVRLDPFLARDAADWARQEKGIVWYRTVSFGQWVSEISGLPMHGGGSKAAERIAREDGSRSIVCSIASHGTGRDGLQRIFATQLVTQPPSSAVAWEQLFGRLGRIGQDADKVEAWIFRHTAEVRASVDTALRRARYVGRTTGQSQRLLAGWLIDA